MTLSFRKGASLAALAILACAFLLLTVNCSSPETETIPDATYGQGGKKVTSKKTSKDGTVEIEVRILDPKGTVRDKVLTTTHPNGEKQVVIEKNDADEKPISKDEEDFDAKGQTTRKLKEEYKDKKLVSGTLDETTNGATKHKIYDAKTEKYEEGDALPSPPIGPPSKNDLTRLFDGECRVDAGTERVNVKTAEACIRPMIEYIDRRQQQMTDRYYYQAGVKTMQAAFTERGLTDLGHADSWGKWMGMTWSQGIKKFYVYHSTALSDSLDTIRQHGYATKVELDYLTDGMRHWLDTELAFPEYFEHHISRCADEQVLYVREHQDLEPFNAEYERLSTVRPYPSGQIATLKEKMSALTKQYEDQIKEIDDELETAGRNIGPRAETHVFEALARIRIAS